MFQNGQTYKNLVVFAARFLKCAFVARFLKCVSPVWYIITLKV